MAEEMTNETAENEKKERKLSGEELIDKAYKSDVKLDPDVAASLAQYRKENEEAEGTGEEKEDSEESTEDLEPAARLEEERAKMDESHYPYEDALAGSKVTPRMGTSLYLKNMMRAMGKPTEETESTFIQSITEDFQWNINSGETVFLNSGSKRFNQQFEKARGTYVVLERGEFPILMYDKTVRMTGEYGFVMTNRYLHIHMRDLVPYRVKLRRISKVIVYFGKTNRDWSMIVLKQLGSKKEYPFFKSLDAERVIEIADVLMREMYHVLAAPKATFELYGTKPEDVDELYREDAADIEAKMGAFRRLLRQLRRYFRAARRMLLESERNESDMPADFWSLPTQEKPEASGQEGENAEKAEEAEEDTKGKKGKKDKKGKASKKDDKKDKKDKKKGKK